MSLEDHIVQLIAALKTHGEALATHAAAIAKGGKATKAKDTPESSQPAAGSATPAASAPAAGQQTQSPAASTSDALSAEDIAFVKRVSPKKAEELAALNSPNALLFGTTELVILLANEYSRDQAVGILAKRRGSVKCSQLKPEELRGVFDEARAAIVAAEAAKAAETANASLV